MQVVDANGNVFGQGLEITSIDGKPKVPIINTDITIGTTAITSGTVGRVLFQGTGNVVQESANLFWDNTNQRLNLISIIGANNNRLNFRAPELGTRLNGVHFTDANDTTSYGYIALSGGGGEMRMFTGNSYFPTIYSNGLERLRIATTGNLLINTTTDAGFKVDVNGTSRFSGLTNFNADVVLNSNRLFIGANNGNLLLRIISTTNLQLFNNNAGATLFLNANGAVQIGSTNVTNWATFSASGHTIYGTTNTNFFSSGNIGVNTATDAGFRLDVNGTARVSGGINIGSDSTLPSVGSLLNCTLYRTTTNGGNFEFRYINHLNTSGTTSIGYFNFTNVSPSSGSGTYNGMRIFSSYLPSGTYSGTYNHLILDPTINQTNGQSHTYRGIYYNPTLTSLTGTTHFAFHSTSGRIRFQGLPTSPTGLSSGEIWNNLGVLTIV